MVGVTQLVEVGQGQDHNLLRVVLQPAVDLTEDTLTHTYPLSKTVSYKYFLNWKLSMDILW